MDIVMTFADGTTTTGIDRLRRELSDAAIGALDPSCDGCERVYVNDQGLLVEVFVMHLSSETDENDYIYNRAGLVKKANPGSEPLVTFTYMVDGRA